MAKLRRASSNAAAALDEAPPLSITDLHRNLIRAMFRLRACRHELMLTGLIDDSAWLMLLDLYLNHMDGRCLNVTALCLKADVPPTTALRRLDTLVRLGLAAKRSDSSDLRRITVALTAVGIEKAQAYLQSMHAELVVALGIQIK